MQYDMDVGGDAVPRRYLARVMAQPQRVTVWGVRIRSGAPASLVWTLWLETRALPHGQGGPALRRSGHVDRARFVPHGHVDPALHQPPPGSVAPSRHRAHTAWCFPHIHAQASARGMHSRRSSGARAVPETSIDAQAAMRRTTLHHPTAAVPRDPSSCSPTPTHTTRHNPPTPVQPSTFCSRHPAGRKTPET
jgi:hypothetical protein